MSAVGIFRPGTTQTGFSSSETSETGTTKMAFFRDTAVCWLFFASDAFLNRTNSNCFLCSKIRLDKDEDEIKMNERKKIKMN